MKKNKNLEKKEITTIELMEMYEELYRELYIEYTNKLKKDLEKYIDNMLDKAYNEYKGKEEQRKC